MAIFLAACPIIDHLSCSLEILGARRPTAPHQHIPRNYLQNDSKSTISVGSFKDHIQEYIQNLSKLFHMQSPLTPAFCKQFFGILSMLDYVIVNSWSSQLVLFVETNF